VEIDTKFEFNSETTKGEDADTSSPTLQMYHQFLWSKPLPGGQVFALERAGQRGHLHLVYQAQEGALELSSDAITNRLRNSPMAKALRDDERPRNLGYTIGSAVIFPRRQRHGMQTINQRRGTHPLIRDRFDLTLECIRRYYAGESSPLGDLLERYGDFFQLFGDFRGYVDFFLLQDLVDSGYNVCFFHEFSDFRSPALPATKTTYLAYVEKSNNFIEARNLRIREWSNLR
jgi:hypothetical protein